MDAEEYLRRGERLNSLAKASFQKNKKNGFSQLDWEIYSTKMDVYDFGKTFAKLKKVIGNYLCNLNSADDEIAKTIQEMTGGRITVRLRDDLCQTIGRGMKLQPGDTVLETTTHWEDGTEYVSFSPKIKATPTSFEHCLFKTGEIWEDARSKIAYCYLYHAYEKELELEQSSEAFREAMRQRMQTEEYQDAVFACIKRLIRLNKHHGTIDYFIRWRDDLAAGLRPTIYVSREDPLPENFLLFLSRNNVTVIYQEDDVDGLKERILKEQEERCAQQDEEFHMADIYAYAEDRDAGIGPHVRINEIPFFVTGSSLRDDFGYPCQYQDWILDRGRLPGFDELFRIKATFFDKKERELFFQPEGYAGGFGRDGWLLRGFAILYEKRHEECEQWKSYEESLSGYARSFENKANLPQKTIKAMQESILNRYFGYVEFDGEVDLKKMREYEKMVEAVIEAYLKGIDATANSIRFRKLGNHDATGLYYPGVKCLCVDYRHPHSFIHEFGHLIDHELGDLSLQAEFNVIRNHYRKRIMKHEASIPSKSIFNMQYYLRPTEIFARSFELYVCHVLDVHNDSVPESFDEIHYPQDEEYLGLIKNYFDELLQGIRASRPAALDRKEDIAGAPKEAGRA